VRIRYWRRRLGHAVERLAALHDELEGAQLDAAALHGAVAEAAAAFERACRALMVPSALPQTGRLPSDPAALVEARHGLDACLVERTGALRAMERCEAAIVAEEAAERHARRELQAVSDEHVLLLTAAAARPKGGGGRDAFDEASIDPRDEAELARCANPPAMPSWARLCSRLSRVSAAARRILPECLYVGVGVCGSLRQEPRGARTPRFRQGPPPPCHICSGTDWARPPLPAAAPGPRASRRLTGQR
jgi:hypothetical protein